MVKRAFDARSARTRLRICTGTRGSGLFARSSAARRSSATASSGYLLTAVANQASKELRRRGRRPTTPLEMARGVPDGGELPDERAAGNEESRIARDVLATLPARRRAVLMLRYGWGLEPSEVCGLIEGLSHRAYRKEITRGVNEVSSKLRLVEQGRWCGNREPVLKAYVAGLADDEQRRQAEHHLAHCRHCTDYVAKLNGHLHEIGSAVGWPGAADVVGGDRISIADRVGELVDRTRESAMGVFNRGGSESADTAAQAAAAGGTRGAGVGAAGGWPSSQPSALFRSWWRPAWAQAPRRPHALRPALRLFTCPIPRSARPVIVPWPSDPIARTARSGRRSCRSRTATSGLLPTGLPAVKRPTKPPMRRRHRPRHQNPHPPRHRRSSRSSGSNRPRRPKPVIRAHQEAVARVTWPREGRRQSPRSSARKRAGVRRRGVDSVSRRFRWWLGIAGAVAIVVWLGVAETAQAGSYRVFQCSPWPVGPGTRR